MIFFLFFVLYPLAKKCPLERKTSHKCLKHTRHKQTNHISSKFIPEATQMQANCNENILKKGKLFY